MIQLIQTVLQFIDTVTGGIVDVLAFVPKVFSYTNSFIQALPAFLVPIAGVALSILIFNRVSRLL